MTAEGTVIDVGTHVRGKILGASNLAIAGALEGEVSIQGELKIEPSGIAAANLNADRIIVCGAVKGDLQANDAIILENGARIVGDLRAPSITITQGALVRGHLESSGVVSPFVQTKGKQAQIARPSEHNVPSLPASAFSSRASTKIQPKKQESIPSHSSSPAPLAAESISTPTPTSNPSHPSAQMNSTPTPTVPVIKKGGRGNIHRKAKA
ncbi:bactofilin family protein [Pajaroellobacter abortibovis]|uniref:Cell shape determination protein CcmA n=1 Tax=Pajaroellobacter abortibovis TaxID=1882918 RepID=A0A1L6MYZ1_9BACT|nr:polymer-forming cytoskeletal protein [Pajaroellobacter abortibovis]APS00699.1 hypothetical protein BCY86_08425 [Pajaroellobacter abortibovis]